MDKINHMRQTNSQSSNPSAVWMLSPCTFIASFTAAIINSSGDTYDRSVKKKTSDVCVKG